MASRRVARRSTWYEIRRRQQQAEQHRADREQQEQPRRRMQRQHGPVAVIGNRDRGQPRRARFRQCADREGIAAADDVAVER
jgi:hypothetical protein